MDKLLPHQLFRMKAKIKEMTENSYKLSTKQQITRGSRSNQEGTHQR